MTGCCSKGEIVVLLNFTADEQLAQFEKNKGL